MLVLLVLAFSILSRAGQLFGDFHAFYCGGAAVLHGLDPYTAGALRSCEAQPQPYGLAFMRHGVIAPVPFPAYTFALFAPFAMLPYVPAAILWLALTLACVALSVAGLERVSGYSKVVCVCVLLASYPIAVLGLGEVAPIVLACVTWAAAGLRERRGWWPAALLAAAAILPHAMLPALVAVLLFVPRLRVALVALGVLLAAGGIALLGINAATGEYAMRVLPAHALSEIGYVAQYGTTWVLHAVGIADAPALRAGNALYALACVVSIAAARRLSVRMHDDALLVLVPLAAAVAFSPFMHYSELTLVFPLALLLAARSRGLVRSLAVAALVLAALPWQWIVGEAVLALPACLIAAFRIALCVTRSERRAFAAAAGTLAYGIVLLLVALVMGPQVQHSAAPLTDAHLAQAAWTQYIRTTGASSGLVWWIAKAPTWCALVLLTACCSYASANEDFEAVAVIDSVPVGA